MIHLSYLLSDDTIFSLPGQVMDPLSPMDFFFPAQYLVPPILAIGVPALTGVQPASVPQRMSTGSSSFSSGTICTWAPRSTSLGWGGLSSFK